MSKTRRTAGALLIMLPWLLSPPTAANTPQIPNSATGKAPDAHSAAKSAPPATSTGGASAPTLPSELLTRSSTDSSPSADRQKHDPSVDERPLVIWTAILALATGLLVCVGGGQLVLFWWQLRTMKATVSDSTRAAGAAERSANLAEKSLLELQRAFVFALDFRWQWHFDPTGKTYWYDIRPVWKNSGNTATKGMITNINYALMDNPLPEQFVGSDAPKCFPAFIGPQAQVLGGQIVITGAELAQVQAGTKYFYFWGWTKYRDVFDGTKEHQTKFVRQLTNVYGNPQLEPNQTDNVVTIFFAICSNYDNAT